MEKDYDFNMDVQFISWHTGRTMCDRRKEPKREKGSEKERIRAMAKEMETPKDEGLQGNETIEEAILGLQKEPTPELLAHVLTVIRRRMKEGGQVILSVEPPKQA